MTKRFLWICSILFAAILSICISRVPEKNGNPGIRLTVFPSGNGWGYQIEQQHKILVYQPYIPAVQEQNPFPTLISARKTGELVLRKIRSGKIPFITRDELASMGVASAP